MKNGVTAALARIRDPGVRWAVVFDTTRWHPVQPPPGEEWDYEPFWDLGLAREALGDLRPGECDPELWEKSDGGWRQAELPANSKSG